MRGFVAATTNAPRQRSVGRLVTAQRRQWRSYTRSQSRRRRQVTWKCSACCIKYWQDRRCTTCGWLWTPQGLEPVGQPGAPPGIEARTEILDAEIAIPKARLARPVGAILDSALARQARAKKNLALVEVQSDSSTTKDGRGEDRDGSGGQVSQRGPTACRAGHIDIRRRRSAGLSKVSMRMPAKPSRGWQRP